MKKIVLASASPRREELLKQLGISFTIYPSPWEETRPQSLNPRDYVYHMAYQKAKKVAYLVEDALVIGADTMIYHQGHMIGKPKTQEEAFSILSSLSAEKHQVFTAFVILDTSSLQEESFIQETQVYFRPLKVEEIKEYIHTGEPFDKAGAYAIQGRGAAFISKIEGCFYGVVGLPLGALIPALYKMGWKERVADG